MQTYSPPGEEGEKLREREGGGRCFLLEGRRDERELVSHSTICSLQPGSVSVLLGLSQTAPISILPSMLLPMMHRLRAAICGRSAAHMDAYMWRGF